MADWNAGNFGFAESEEEEDFENNDKQSFSGRSGVIFLIDCSQSMFEETTEDDESHFKLCLKCVATTMTNKIINSDKDLLSVIFYGTEQSKNASDFKHIYALQDIEQPSASRILDLEKLSEDTSDFGTKFGHSDNYSMNDVLWTCSSMFSSCSQKLSSKKILLFTNTDDPHWESESLKRQAATKAKDLYDIGIEIDLLHLQKSDQRFDISLFYKDIIRVPEDEQLDVYPDASVQFAELLHRVRAIEHKKRSLASIPFALGQGLEFGVSVFNLVQTARKPSGIRLFKKTNEELKQKVKIFSEETAELLMPSDVRKYQEYGGQKIVFEQDEVAEINQFNTPGLKLLGFKPRSSLKRHYYVRTAQFIYPNEKMVTGSLTLFSALLTRCLERDVLPYCALVARKTSSPHIVALLPQEEEKDEQNLQVMPPGFHLIYLPFADDFRKLNFEDENKAKASVDQIDKFKEVIKKLKFSFNPLSFENPVLQTHYRNLEALALDRDEVEPVEDCTEPNLERIDSRTGSLLSEFKDLVFPPGYDPTAKTAAAKRKTGASGSTAAKRDKPNVAFDTEQLAKEGKLNSLKVADLKSVCLEKGLPTSGKKADLVSAIEAHFGI